MVTKDTIRLVKAIANVHGWSGDLGGWIYDDHSRVLSQGWDELARLALRLGWVVSRAGSKTQVSARVTVVGWVIDWRAVDRFRLRKQAG